MQSFSTIAPLWMHTCFAQLRWKMLTKPHSGQNLLNLKCWMCFCPVLRTSNCRKISPGFVCLQEVAQKWSKASGDASDPRPRTWLKRPSSKTRWRRRGSARCTTTSQTGDNQKTDHPKGDFVAWSPTMRQDWKASRSVG